MGKYRYYRWYNANKRISAFQQKKHVSIKKVRDQDNNWKILFEPHSALGKKSSNESDPFVDLNDARERTQVGFKIYPKARTYLLPFESN